MSLRKSLRDTSEPSALPRLHTLLAHFSNSVSCVTPRSSVMASYSVRPGDFRLLLGSPPSRCLTTSVVLLRPPTLLTPATNLPSHFTRNLKFLYGSKRCVLVGNCAMDYSLRGNLAGDLLNLDDDKLRRFQGCEADDDIDDAAIDVVLSRRLTIAFHEISFLRCLPLEGPFSE